MGSRKLMKQWELHLRKHQPWKLTDGRFHYRNLTNFKGSLKDIASFKSRELIYDIVCLQTTTMSDRMVKAYHYFQIQIKKVTRISCCYVAIILLVGLQPNVIGFQQSLVGLQPNCLSSPLSTKR